MLVASARAGHTSTRAEDDTNRALPSRCPIEAYPSWERHFMTTKDQSVEETARQVMLSRA